MTVMVLKTKGYDRKTRYVFATEVTARYARKSVRTGKMIGPFTEVKDGGVRKSFLDLRAVAPVDQYGKKMSSTPCRIPARMIEARKTIRTAQPDDLVALAAMDVRIAEAQAVVKALREERVAMCAEAFKRGGPPPYLAFVDEAELHTT